MIRSIDVGTIHRDTLVAMVEMVENGSSSRLGQIYPKTRATFRMFQYKILNVTRGSDVIGRRNEFVSALPQNIT